MSAKFFSFQTRAEVLHRLEKNKTKYDIMIVGGGITGAGLARDAALRGLSVLLVEANDFAFGTSSRSSKLIHGGLRYLENFEFKLVFEALSERQKLYRIAPHLVHPLRFVFPVYDYSRVGMAKLACGMWLYDGLAMFQGKNHEQLDSKETVARAPILSTRGLKGSFVYSDAYMDDDRLAIENLRSAHYSGADCINYVAAEKVEFSNGRVNKIICRDGLSNKSFSVEAHHLISTVGPWTDDFGHKVFDDWKDILKPSKGVHLTFSRQRFPVQDAVVLSDDRNERIVFVIPRNDMVIVGTTDTYYNGSPADVVAGPEDVEYLLKMSREYFPHLQLTKEDILGSYAGVRPLVKSEESSVGKTSREHTVISDPRGVTFVAGGKYTTYRNMAESILDSVLDDFSIEQKAKTSRCQTDQPLNPLCSQDQLDKSDLMVERWARESGLSFTEISALVARHGMEAELILRQNPNSTYWQLEASHAIDQTMCVHLSDFFWRRSHLFLSEKNHGCDLLIEIADVFARQLGWSAETREAEIAQVHLDISKEMAWMGADSSR